jgi:arylsulfatase A-like enzyme
MRHTVLFLLTATLALVSAQITATAAETAKRPNVLFIAIDDMRPQLGCYGDPLAQTPNMDKLAAGGMVFRNAFCQQALCSPSRISLLSGRYPSTTQIFQIGPELRSTMPQIVTLPQHFKNNGYFTRSLGKVYHVGIDDPDSWSVPPWHSKNPRYGPVGQKMVQEYVQKMKAEGKQPPKKGKGMAFYAGPAFESPEVDDEYLLDGDTTKNAIGALRELAAKPDQPFFLGVGFANPHVPWVAPKKYWDLFDESKFVLPDNPFTPRNAPVFAAKSGQDFHWYANVPPEEKMTDAFKKECLHGYLAAISYVDAQVGRLLAEVDTLKLNDDTIVVLWGDHGYYMGEHGWWGSKHNNYEGATRAPLIVRVPGQKTAGQTTESLVEFVDIAPSLAQLCALPKENGFQGRSFVPLLEDPKATIHETALSFYPMGGYMGNAMRTERYRYVEWIDKAGKIAARELYDHASDPKENTNVADAPENKPVIEKLGEQLHQIGRVASPVKPTGLPDL